MQIQENAWFHCSSETVASNAYYSVKDFYKNKIETPQSKELLKKIARIKFHLLLSLTPSYHLRDAFYNQDLPVVFDTYQCKRKSEIFTDENKDLDVNNQPIVYNILGELNKRESLIFFLCNKFSMI